MNEVKLNELRRLGADPDVAHMIAAVMQRLGLRTQRDLPEEELDMLIESAHEMDQQLGGGVTTPRPEETPVEFMAFEQQWGHTGDCAMVDDFEAACTCGFD